ncbi:MAG: glycoside hydrolase family 3 N-terminal domain-containing protein [Victivallaceae bacterium]|nr:glycoside hydrolase family 3 N-terminal domain-containing protein [Victivallaceae bacterium]
MNLSGMTLREKIGQCVQLNIADLPVDSESELADFFGKYPVGSLFSGSDVIQKFGTKIHSSEAIDLCRRVAHGALAVAGDLERGFGRAQLPAELALGAAGDEALAYEYGRWTAIEARKANFDWAFAPVADLAWNWLNPLTNHRTLGSDPERVAALVCAIVRGMQDNFMSATAKHFPGDGVDFRDQHLSCSINSLSRDEYMATYGKIYRALFAVPVDAVMAGHISLPFVDPGNPPMPATLSSRITRDLLRGEFRFDGVVISDALTMSGFVMHKPAEERLIRCFNAGVDVLLWPGLDFFDAMERAVAEGRVSTARLDEAVSRMLAMKARRNLDGAKRPPAGDGDPGDLGEQIAARGAVLKANGHNRIPFDETKVRRVLLWFATDNVSLCKAYFKTLERGFAAFGAKAFFAVNGNCLDLRKREQAGERFDEVIFLFDQKMHSTKNCIRPAGEAGECLWTMHNCEAHDPVAVGLDSPYLPEEDPYLPTLVNMNSDGDEVMRVLPKLLYGKLPFTGRDPVIRKN